MVSTTLHAKCNVREIAICHIIFYLPSEVQVWMSCIFAHLYHSRISFSPRAVFFFRKFKSSKDRSFSFWLFFLNLPPVPRFLSSRDMMKDIGGWLLVVTKQSHHIDTAPWHSSVYSSSTAWQLLQSATVLATCVYNRLGFAGLEVILILRQLCFVPSFVAATVVINRQGKRQL